MYYLWKESPIFLENMDQKNCSSENCSFSIFEPDPNYWSLLLSVFPVLCICGNGLVIAAVWSNKFLQNSTNFLLISLAVADMMVGAFVMPFSIYLAVNRLHWHFPAIICNIYCVFDVSASTSSIINLVLISCDRLVAVSRHTEYQTYKHRKRVYWAIFGCWFFSISVGLPLGIGLNVGSKESLEELHHCGIINPNYMLFSSIFAFYIPCIVMLATYGFIFYKLKSRMAALQLQEMAAGHFMSFGADISNIAQTAFGIAAGGRRAMVSWEKPFIERLQQTVQDQDSEISDTDKRQLATILESVHYSNSSSSSSTDAEVSYGGVILPPTDRPEPPIIQIDPPSQADGSPPLLKPVQKLAAKRRFSDALLHGVQDCQSHALGVASDGFRRLSQSFSLSADENINFQHNPALRNNKKMRRLSEAVFDFSARRESFKQSATNLYVMARRESLAVAREKLAGLKDWALDLLAKLKSRQGMQIRRERRATKLVTTVMVVFLICWLPFFTLNLFKVYCLWRRNWSSSLEGWFHFFSWLGYMNSCLNPVIYTLINKKFRLTFKRLLRIRNKEKTISWMLPPKIKEPIWARCCCDCFVQYWKRRQDSYKRQSSSCDESGRSIEKGVKMYDMMSVTRPQVATIEEESERSYDYEESDDEDSVNKVIYV